MSLDASSPDLAIAPDELAPAALRQWRNLSTRLRPSFRTLPDKPTETLASTLRALWHLAQGRQYSNEAALLHRLTALTEPQLHQLERLIDQRGGGVPLAHLTERQQFMGLEMVAGPGALIPRPETELLARFALDAAKVLAAAGPATGTAGDATAGAAASLIGVDVCTGSGNVAAALAHHLPAMQMHAADLSADAIALARINIAHLGLSQQVRLYVGDLFEPLIAAGLLARVDLITCNPPYISSARVPAMAPEIAGHEPAMAFDGGPFGIGIVRRTIRDAPRLLRPGGCLLIEVGLGQGPAVLQSLKANPAFTGADGLTDSAGQIRVVRATAKSSSTGT